MTSKYIINEHRLDRRKKKNNSTGTMIGEYNHFFLFQSKNGYKFSISKNALHCKHYSLEKVP
jgi:hypothetical protein